jgi:hypothetical protein
VRWRWILLVTVVLAACKGKDDPDATVDAAVPADAALADAAVADAVVVADAPSADAASGAADASFADAVPSDAFVAFDSGLPPLPDGAFPDGGPLGGFVVASVRRADGAGGFVYWLARIPLDGGPALNLTAPDGVEGGGLLGVSPDGQFVVYEGHVASAGARATILRRRTDGTGGPVDLLAALPPSDDFFRYLVPRFSPRGDRVAFLTGDFHLWTVGVDGSAPVDVAAAHQANTEYAWSPRGDRLLYLSENASGQELTVTCADHDCSHAPLPGQRATDPVFSPDGKSIVLSIDPGNGGAPGLWLVDVAAGTGHRVAASFFAMQGSNVFSPDGQRLAYLVGDADAATVHVACVDGSCDHALPLPATLNPRTDDGFGFSPDGRHLLVVGEDAYLTPYRLFVACADGSCVHEHKPTGDAYAQMALDARGPHHPPRQAARLRRRAGGRRLRPGRLRARAGARRRRPGRAAHVVRRHDPLRLRHHVALRQRGRRPAGAPAAQRLRQLPWLRRERAARDLRDARRRPQRAHRRHRRPPPRRQPVTRGRLLRVRLRRPLDELVHELDERAARARDRHQPEEHAPAAQVAAALVDHAAAGAGVTLAEHAQLALDRPGHEAADDERRPVAVGPRDPHERHDDGDDHHDQAEEQLQFLRP